MTQHQLLDNVNHQDLKIITKRSVKYGDNISSVLTFPEEFRDIQTHYPICFSKNSQTGHFDAIALLGFNQAENLFLNDEDWQAAYIPLMVQRSPFLLGMPADNGTPNNTLAKVYFDAASPRVNTQNGESVFLEHGGYSPYLQRITEILDTIHSGLQSSKIFFKLLTDYELIEPFSLSVTLQDGSANQLEGLYTINEDKLNALPSDVLQKLQKAGWLSTIYMVIASLSNLRTLIRYKNKCRG